MRSSGAQKAILFATNGFQKGALEYAKAHGIALVRILEGELTYETRSADYLGVRRSPPPWANIQPFVGQLIFIKDNVIHVSLIEHGHPGPLKSYLSSGQAKPL
jgi:restriction system protein